MNMHVMLMQVLACLIIQLALIETFRLDCFSFTVALHNFGTR